MLTEAEFDRRAEEIDRLRAALQKAEAELDAVIVLMAIDEERQKAEADARQARNETVLERELYEQMHDVAIRHRQDSDKWAALAADATARAEKAEAERDEARDLLGKACGLAMVSLSEGENWVGVPDQEPCVSIVRTKKDLRSERARAEKYLEVMTRLVETAHTNAEWLEPMAAIRAIVEEARRG